MHDVMKNFVEKEREYTKAKHDLETYLAENMPNPFMKVDYAAVRREVNKFDSQMSRFTE